MYKRKKTYEQIVQQAEEFFASLSEDVKNSPDIDLEQFKKNYISIMLDTNCDTSGVWVTENPDGSIEIGYEDYELPYYGGMDHEYMSRMDKVNADKLRELLSKKYEGTLKEMVFQAFTFNNGESLNHEDYENFCKENGIEMHDFCWTS
ncbi:MAG: hypothetical protein K2J16_02065 [Clostridia bacterium]|nr:hypothetical protein [Clostridia bacterium]